MVHYMDTVTWWISRYTGLFSVVAVVDNYVVNRSIN